MNRALNDQESTLLKHLLNLVHDSRAQSKLPEFIEVMDDGGMGSIQFGDRLGRTFGRDIVQVKYIDTDNTPVFITLIEDNFGALFELEFWKVDNSKLLTYPSINQVT